MAKTREPVYPSSRKAALRMGDTKYKTDKPCSQGHFAPRYTTSGACSECLSAAGIKARYGSQERKDEATLLREAKQQARIDMTEIKLRCYPADLDNLRALVVAATLARFPMLDRADVVLNKAPGALEGGTQLHKFNVSGSDFDLLRGIANTLLNQRGPNIAAAREKMLRDQLQMAAKEAEDNGEPAFDPGKA